jgi:hypothetical protein
MVHIEINTSLIRRFPKVIFLIERLDWRGTGLGRFRPRFERGDHTDERTRTKSTLSMQKWKRSGDRGGINVVVLAARLVARGQE